MVFRTPTRQLQRLHAGSKYGYRTPSTPGGKLRPSRALAQSAVNRNHELFEYTSGRWIYNENARLAERRLPFNVDELARAAANSVNKPVTEVKSLRKTAEGGFDRVFEILMKDGTTILARLPYPSTLPCRLAVASEVATIDFVHAHDIPTPKILAYATGENSVGSEYILMEKLSGQPIGDAWYDLSDQQRLQIMHDIVKLESKLFDIRLPASGSIYYTRDLAQSTLRIGIPGLGNQFCIGPYTGLRWWFGKRGKLKIDRGPHADTLRTLQAPAEKELSYIRAFGQPRFPIHRQHREAFKYQKQDPAVHAASLEKYLRIAPYLIPARPELSHPILRHPDLQPHNIFISGDYRITGLIDWQHATVLPTFLAAGIPKSFQNYADPESRSFTPPRLPADYDSLDEPERSHVREQFRHRYLHFYYLGFTQQLNPFHWRALDQEPDLLRGRLFDHASEPWEGLNTTLQYDLVQVAKKRNEIVPQNQDGAIPDCPISFTQEEADDIDALEESHRDADGDVENINGFIGVASDGWTTNENFEIAKSKAAYIREQALTSADDDPWLKEMSERHWPFDDYDEAE